MLLLLLPDLHRGHVVLQVAQLSTQLQPCCSYTDDFPHLDGVAEAGFELIYIIWQLCLINDDAIEPIRAGTEQLGHV